MVGDLDEVADDPALVISQGQTAPRNDISVGRGMSARSNPQAHAAIAPDFEAAPKPDLESFGLILWNSETIAAPDRLVRGLIREQALTILGGATGSGKTFFALDLAAHLAHGWKWCGRRVERCGILYVGAEGQSGLHNRIKAWRIANHSTEPNIPFVLFPKPIDL